MATASVLGTVGQARPLTSATLQDRGWMTGLSSASATAVMKASAELTFRPGDLIYSESEPATGAYIVRRGKVKLVASSQDGKALILRIALPGEIIGLSAALSMRANDTNAEVLEPTTVAYIKSQSLYQLMDRCGDLALRLAEQLSIEYSSLCQELSTLGLQRSAMSRLAKLLIGFVDTSMPQSDSAHMECALTHEDMAQMIGTSRETVTRLLRELRDQEVGTLKHDVLAISSIRKLKALID